MPEKYHIDIDPRPARFPRIAKYSAVEVEGCLGCLECVKRSCIYDVYDKRRFDADHVLDTGDALCVNCMRCVQECKKGILAKSVNPRFKQMGDHYWTPDVITNIWDQAETGKVPVSGAGYGGPFVGAGFDQIWTDMSEIVRPTRDGIHGREYISTLIELGGRPSHLEFDEKGNLLTRPSAFVELPMPLILELPGRGKMGESTRKAIIEAAGRLGTFVIADCEQVRGFSSEQREGLIAKFDPSVNNLVDVENAPVLELAYSDDVMSAVARIKGRNPQVILSIRVPLDEQAADRVSRLAGSGAEVIHLQASDDGRGLGDRTGDFATKLVREVHLRLVEDLLRGRVTILFSGGIAMAEHVAKIMLCGADGVGINLALLVAMECRLCGNCMGRNECPVCLDTVPAEYGTQRIVNLCGSWHSQLIEVMGAMGMREIRRLRGEVGRAMFFDDLEKTSFAPIFGTRREGLHSLDEVAAVPASMPSLDGINRDIVEPCTSRYRNRLSKYKVVRTLACVSCGKCTDVCAYGVHVKAGNRMPAPKSHLCVGSEVCREKGSFCGDVCPQEAIRVGIDPMWETFGDHRWTPDLIVSTWAQAETGRPPENGLQYQTGASGGGFDRIDIAFPQGNPDPNLDPAEIDLSLSLNRRRDDDRPRLDIGIPIYGGGMSFGAISETTIVARARAYAAFGSLTCTGEGGYPDALIPYADNVITQVATGLFGVNEETIQRAPVIEFKYAQGAKPGLGGHLLGDKVTAKVARIRESVEGNALFSPFPFHSVYSIEDHKKHIDWMKVVNPRVLVSAKVSTPADVDMVAVGSFHAGAHIIHIDGSYGGTGAAPDIAKKNIAMPIEYAIPKVHGFLLAEGLRDQMTLIASGGIRTAWDIAKAIALGADGVVIATSEVVALECIRCGRCESGRGCPRGIATTDTELSAAYSVEWASQRIINLLASFCEQLREILWWLGMRSVRELVGRTDVLTHREYKDQARLLEREPVKSC